MLIYPVRYVFLNATKVAFDFEGGGLPTGENGSRQYNCGGGIWLISRVQRKRRMCCVLVRS